MSTTARALPFSRVRAYMPGNALRPGTVTALRGVIFQSDGSSAIGRLFIRPFEVIDRWLGGALPEPGEPSLAMHAGIHVEIDHSRDFVVEQLVGSWYMDLSNGLNWTPIDQFRQRDRGGWDVTVETTAFRGIDERLVSGTVDGLNSIQGHPFLGEDCTALVERAFGGRRLFADSPLLRRLGIAARVGDPALPLLRPDAQLDQRTSELIAFDDIRDLPDADADPESPNAALWLARLAPAVGFGLLAGYSFASRRSAPASSTARKFFR